MTKKTLKFYSGESPNTPENNKDIRVTRIFWFCAGFVLALVLIIIAR